MQKIELLRRVFYYDAGMAGGYMKFSDEEIWKLLESADDADRRYGVLIIFAGRQINASKKLLEIIENDRDELVRSYSVLAAAADGGPELFPVIHGYVLKSPGTLFLTRALPSLAVLAGNPSECKKVEKAAGRFLRNDDPFLYGFASLSLGLIGAVGFEKRIDDLLKLHYDNYSLKYLKFLGIEFAGAEEDRKHGMRLWKQVQPARALIVALYLLKREIASDEIREYISKDLNLQEMIRAAKQLAGENARAGKSGELRRPAQFREK